MRGKISLVKTLRLIDEEIFFFFDCFSSFSLDSQLFLYVFNKCLAANSY